MTTRLLIADTQAGSVIGRKGDIIKQIRDRSKAFIKVLTQEENPSIAVKEDRVVQVSVTAVLLSNFDILMFIRFDAFCSIP